MTDIEIHSVTFVEGGLAIQYMEATDVRVKGAVFQTHTLQMAAKHPDYGDDIDLLHRQVVKILKNAREDFDESEPFLPDDEDPDDERGMGE